MQTYRTLIKNSLKISWNNKYLWFFGLFSMLIGFGVEYDFALNYYFLGESGGYSTLHKLFTDMGIFSGGFFVAFWKAFARDPINGGIILAILLIFLFLLGFLIWLSIVSHVAIIDGAAKRLSGKASSFREGIEKGIKFFWPAFLMISVQKIAILLLALMLVLFLIALGPVVKLLYVLFFAISLVLSFVVKYALSHLVIKEMGMKESLGEGWRLFRNNWLATVEIDLVLFFVYGLISVAMILCIMNLKFLVTFLAVIMIKLNPMLGFWFVVLASIGVSFFVILAGALVAIFYASAWTSMYFELIGGGVKSRIARFFTKQKSAQ